MLKSSRNRVALMLSGGVDSAVAAALLKRQGFAVTAVFMKNWALDLGEGCPWVEDQRAARQVATHLGLNFFTFNFEEVYYEKVVSRMILEYGQGLTPNPDIFCNAEVKFRAFVEKAKTLGIDYVATGHYARRRRRGNLTDLLAGVDVNKDQSYFLYRIPNKVLEKTIFPIGGYEKKEIRQLAQSLGLPNAHRPDSQGICFMGKINVTDFLRQSLATVPGPVMASDGEIVGSHSGLPFYTIGQRKGLNIGGGVPYYVIDKLPAENTLLVARGRQDPKLYSSKIQVNSWHERVKVLNFPFKIRARFRHQQPLQSAYLEKMTNGRVVIRFTKPQFAPAPGQSLVAYQGQRVVGGGIIERAL